MALWIGYRDGIVNPWVEFRGAGDVSPSQWVCKYSLQLRNSWSIAWAYLIVSVSVFVIRHYSQNKNSGLYVILGLYLLGSLW